MKDIGQLTAFIGKITEKVIPKIVQAQQETAKVMCEDIKGMAPVDTGEYQKSIKVSKTQVKKSSIETRVYTNATVSTTGGKTYNLGFLLESGTNPHLILPVNASTLHFVINGKDVFAKRVNHPGTVAQPHFKPGLEKNVSLYMENIRKAIREAGK